MSQQQTPHRIFDPNTVVGASYSHADLLKYTPPSLHLDSDRFRADCFVVNCRGISPHTRSHTPSRSPIPTRSPRNSDSKSASSNVTSPRQPYRDLLPQSGKAWDTPRDHEEDDENDDELAYDDDEDEFGLPSVTSSRKSKSQALHREQTSGSGYDTSSRGLNGSTTLIPDISGMRLRANSSDIAEEREVLAYPNAKAPEGKILRPQYKEILNGKISFR